MAHTPWLHTYKCEFLDVRKYHEDLQEAFGHKKLSILSNDLSIDQAIHQL